MSEYDKQNDAWEEQPAPGQLSMWEEKEYHPSPEPSKKGTGRGVIALVLCGALLVGLAGGAAGGYFLGNRRAPSGSLPDEQPTLQVQPDTAGTDEQPEEGSRPEVIDQAPLVITTNKSGVLLDPAEVYAANNGAVVSIANEYTTQNIYGQVSSHASSGSGFIVDPDGYIVTNYHVVKGAQTLTVTLASGDSYPAELVGGDEDNDVALLKIEGSGFATCKVGDSDTLRVGEMVAAIGNPLGELTNTLTVGYISALDREINTDGTPINMLQTDAAINSGNSGGPLFDMYGNVIGITTAKYASSSVEGLGFAIPINDAMKIVADLKMYGYVIGRPYFGVYTDDLTVTMASYYNLPVGVYVTSVVEGAAADKAGLQGGDIICSIDGKRCQTQTELSSIMKQYSAGDTAQVEIYRSGEYRTVSITFDEKPKEDAGAQQTTPSTGSTGGQSSFPFFGFGYGG